MVNIGETTIQNVIELDRESFVSTIQDKDKLVVVEFYLPECPHCQRMAPIYEDVSRELADRAVFARIHAGRNLDLATQYGVRGTPTFKFFCRDRVLGEVVGETGADALRDAIAEGARRQPDCASGSNSYRLDGNE